MEIVHVYQKKRSEFGRQCVFADRHAEVLADIPPDEALGLDYLVRNPCDVASQNTKQFSEHEVNTDTHETENRGICHVEGGWPKDVDPNEAEQVIRYRKKAEKEEQFAPSIVALSQAMEHLVKQNNALDIYEDYFPDENAASAVTEAPSAKTVNVFRDPNSIPRGIADLSWYPDGARKVAAAYSILEFQKAPPNVCLDSYIWDIENPNEPEMTLTPSSPIVSLTYNPKDVHTLVGGCYNGQILVWDTRRGSRPVETSPIEKSHRDPVHSVRFLQSKTGSDCFSTSTDGQVLWWDIRKLTEPVETLELDPYQDGNALGGLCVEYESTMPTKFMIGTEQGLVINGNRKGKTPAEKLAAVYEAHHGPVYTLRRNPFFPKYFLSVGDWAARIWSEDVKESPIMWSKYHSSYLTCGTWSPTRPAVAFTAKSDGSLDCWDYLFKSNEPCLTLQVTDSVLNTVEVEEGGSYVACGDKAGVITLLELGSALSTMLPGEKASVSAMFEQETSREKTLASRMRELRANQMKKERVKSARSDQGNQPAEDDEEGDPIELAEKMFWEIVDPGRLKADKAPEITGGDA